MRSRIILFVSKHWRNTVYSNVWISLCAAFWILETEWAWGQNSGGILPAFGFFATVFLYNFQRAVKLFRKPSYSIPGRNSWLVKNRRAIGLLAIVGGAATLFIAFMMPFRDWLVMAISGVVSVLYVTKIGRKGSKWVAIREVPYIKIYLIALVWVIVGVVLPYVHFQMEFELATGMMMIAEKFLFIVAITVPFDVRDLKYDEESMRTLPQVLGERGALLTAVVFSLLSLAVAAWLWNNGVYSKPILVGLLITSAITIAVILGGTSKRKELYFTGILDGLFLVRAILVGLAVFYA